MKPHGQVSGVESELERTTEFNAREALAKSYFSAANKARDDVDALMVSFIASNEVLKTASTIRQVRAPPACFRAVASSLCRSFCAPCDIILGSCAWTPCVSHACCASARVPFFSGGDSFGDHHEHRGWLAAAGEGGDGAPG